MRNGLNLANDNIEWGEGESLKFYIAVPPHLAMVVDWSQTQIDIHIHIHIHIHINIRAAHKLGFSPGWD